MSRRQAPLIEANPKYLAKLQKGANGPEIALDLPGGDEHIIIDPTGGRVAKDRPEGLIAIPGAIPLSGPNLGGFDSVFSGHLGLLAPGYGTPEDVYEVLRAWALSQAVRDLMPVRPIAFFAGPPGSTKSTTAAAVAQLWFGTNSATAQPVRVTDSQREMLGSFAINPYLLFDNVETPSPWLMDTLCLVATGGTLTTRILHTTAGVYLLKPDAFIGMTSFSTTCLTRGDLLSRCLVFDLLPPNGIGFTTAADWQAKVDAGRVGFWAEAVRATRAVLGKLVSGNLIKPGSHERLQDFFWIGEAIADEFGGHQAALRFQRGMAVMALARFRIATREPRLEPLVALALRPDAADRWYTTSDMLRASAEMTGADRGFDLTLRSEEAFVKWARAVHVTAPGALKLDSRYSGGRLQWNVRIPDVVVEATRRLDQP